MRKVLVGLLFLSACGTGTPPRETAQRQPRPPAPAPSAPEARPASCPAQAPAPDPLPGVQPAHRTLGYWMGRWAEYGDLDRPIMAARDIDNHNRALEAPVDGRVLGQTDLLAPVDQEDLLRSVHERLAYVRGRLSAGEYQGPSDRPVDLRLLDAPGELPALTPELRVATAEVPIRCTPLPHSLYTDRSDLRFDRNACSTAHAGEPLQLLARWGRGGWLARTPYALGWVAADAPLGEALTERQARAALVTQPRPLTRRALLERAFALLGEPYGWGGMGGGRDCSRFLMDVFGRFGLALPRHSARQALAGTFSVDVTDVTRTADKLRIIDSAAEQGIVLLHFPGHIMLYLGRDEAERPMAIHAFAEYVEPCEGTAQQDGSPFETVRTVDRITVSDLSLGRGTSRRAFLERITRVTVLGTHVGPALRGVATLRAAAPVRVPPERRCSDSTAVAMFRSPRVANRQQPVRIIVASSEDLGPVQLVLIDPDGRRIEPPLRRLGGPPHAYWTRVDAPQAGRWTAVIGDGSRVAACEQFRVLQRRPRITPVEIPATTEGATNGETGPASDADGQPTAATPPPPAWQARWRWEADTENLYSAWVEQLFQYPDDADRTWPNLQTLLQDQDRNFFYDHLSQQEEERLELQPDCADLPYFLRAYFAWKVRLPFAYRQCSRGRQGRPPSCGDLHTNHTPRVDPDDVDAFARFMRAVGRGVHAASARTHPRDSETDVYPVPMTRRDLRPGTVFADPYGHLLVIAGWQPQGIEHYGVMVGADAQPDGTIGRRRFWRGSFLFTPETHSVGAGFKAWRPLVYDRREGTITSIDNRDLRRARQHSRYSRQQYQGSTDDFYERMDALINPRPLDAAAVQASLVDALAESVARRIVSVQNGTEYMQAQGWRTVEMPEGLAIFQTEGPWEDFSTPSRDMRLLIAMDAVTAFPDVVRRSPDRFGVAAQATEATEAAVDRLRAELDGQLEARSFSYVRSDGTEQRFSLRDVTRRAQDFEMAYNPNDCVEIRWAAPADSAEQATCNRHAEPAQRALMAEYRAWFASRQRPAR